MNAPTPPSDLPPRSARKKATKRYPAVLMGTCVVPWTETYAFDERLFRMQVRDLARTLTRHLYIFGTAGEGYAVSDAQFERIARVFHEACVEADAQPTLGIISLSLPTILERIERGIAWGFRRFQVSLPGWGALNAREVEAFFGETCGRFRDCDFMHYNLLRTKRLVTPEEYGRLAQEHPNLVAAKNTTTDTAFLAELLERAPQMQHFLGEAGYAAMRDRFECGLLLSLSGMNPARAQQFFASRGAALAGMAGELKAVLGALKTVIGSTAHIDGAYDKVLYQVRQPAFPLRLLPPYQSADETTAREQFRRLIAEAAPAWWPEHDASVMPPAGTA